MIPAANNARSFDEIGDHRITVGAAKFRAGGQSFVVQLNDQRGDVHRNQTGGDGGNRKEEEKPGFPFSRTYDIPDNRRNERDGRQRQLICIEHTKNLCRRLRRQCHGASATPRTVTSRQ